MAGEILAERTVGEECDWRGALRMKRLYLTVEGQTEATFAQSVLTPHLAGFNVFLGPPRFTGLRARRGGRIPRGGLLSKFAPTFQDMRDWLKQDQSAEARFSLMVDLYSLPHDFPGYDAGMAQAAGTKQAIALEKSLADELGDARFIPYLQVHEFECVVLADPCASCGALRVPESAARIAMRRMCRLCDAGRYQSWPPFASERRIKQRIPAYDENVAGPLLAGDIGLSTLRQTCPHFGEWLRRLEQLDEEGA